jgi:hypothetical protein
MLLLGPCSKKRSVNIYYRNAIWKSFLKIYGWHGMKRGLHMQIVSHGIVLEADSILVALVISL